MGRDTIPPLSFVRKQLLIKKIRGRIDDQTWKAIREAWRRSTPALQRNYEKTPLAGLHLPRRSDMDPSKASKLKRKSPTAIIK